MSFIVTGGKKNPHSCSYCRRDITLQCRIKCADCPENISFQLCVDCFASGINLYPHVNTHNYRVIDCLEDIVFTKDWSANEELLLLEGIEKFGAGNWKTIADYIGTNKTTKQLEDHYWEDYMGVHGYCLPSNTIIKGQVAPAQTLSVITQEIPSGDNEEIDIQAAIAEVYETRVIDGYTRGEEVLREKTKDLRGAAGTKETKSKENEIKERNAALPGGDLPGFMPLREDFDIEFDNDAEVILADMEFDETDDHPSEKELKLQVIKIYNSKLAERNNRKRFVIDRGLVDLKKQLAFERRLSKEERDLLGRLKVFARFHSPGEHEVLVDSVLKARRLRGQIELYQHYRRMGIRTLDQAAQYEVDRKKRDAEIKARKQRESSSYLYESGRASVSGAGAGDMNPGSSSAFKRRRGGGGFQAEVSSLQECSSSLESTDSSLKASVVSSVHMNSEACRGRGLDVARAPHVELLSAVEVQLCEKLCLLPGHYLAIKEVLVRESYRNGLLTEEGVQRLLKLDGEACMHIYDFFVKDVVKINDPDRQHALYISPRLGAACNGYADGVTDTADDVTSTVTVPGRKRGRPKE